MGRNTTRAFALSGTMMLLAGPALADWRGGYIGIDVGQSSLDRDASFSYAVQADRTSQMFTVRGGFRFNRYFAIEGGYTDLGDFTATLVPPCAYCPVESARTSIRGGFVNAIGFWPVARHFELQGSIGVYYRTLDTVSRAPEYGTSSTGDLYAIYQLGLGIAVPFDEHFEMNLACTRYMNLNLAYGPGYESFDDPSPRWGALSLGATYRF
jgi:OOP family OmpA-OmpF porin